MLATATARSIRRAMPQARLTGLCRRACLEVFEGSQVFDEVGVTAWRPSTTMDALIGWIRERRFDAALLLKPNSGPHLAACRLAGVPHVVGASTEPLGAFLDHNAGLHDEWSVHEVQRQLRMVREGLGIEVTQEPTVFPCRPHFVADVVVAPHTGGTARPWPIDRWRELTGSLECSVALVGAPGESSPSIPCDVDLTGRTSIHGLAAVLAGAKLVVAANTFVRHLASAVGTPQIALETENHPDRWSTRWSPWMSPHRTLDGDPLPSVQKVQAAVENALDR